MLVDDFVEYSVSGCGAMLVVMIVVVGDVLEDGRGRCDDLWGEPWTGRGRVQ